MADDESDRLAEFSVFWPFRSEQPRSLERRSHITAALAPSARDLRLILVVKDRIHDENRVLRGPSECESG